MAPESKNRPQMAMPTANHVDRVGLALCCDTCKCDGANSEGVVDGAERERVGRCVVVGPRVVCSAGNSEGKGRDEKGKGGRQRGREVP